MWSLFKKRKTESVSKIEIWHKLFLFIQSEWAKRMGAITSNLSKGKLICLLGLFVFLTGGFCIHIFLKSFSNVTPNIIKIVSLSKPVDVFEKSFGIRTKPLPISIEEFKRIIGFRVYLDSLKRSPSGNQIYDSIDRCRPGLMDSLVFIENYYKSNLKD